MRVIFRKSYVQDIQLFRDRGQAFWYLLFAAIALAAPLFLEMGKVPIKGRAESRLIQEEAARLMSDAGLSPD